MKRWMPTLKLGVVLAVVFGAGIVGLPRLANARRLYKLPYPGGTSYYVTSAGAYPPCRYGAVRCGLRDAGGQHDCGRPRRTVKYVREDSTVCGGSSAFGNSANYVVIDHGDGTQALYLHVQYLGALVNVGQKVAQGQPSPRAE